MAPVEYNVVAEVEMFAPSDAGIPAGVAGKEIVVEGAVSAAPGCAEGVVVEVERFAGYAHWMVIFSAGILLRDPSGIFFMYR